MKHAGNHITNKRAAPSSGTRLEALVGGTTERAADRPCASRYMLSLASGSTADLLIVRGLFLRCQRERTLKAVRDACDGCAPLDRPNRTLL